MSIYTQDAIDRVCKRAIAAVKARQKGALEFTPPGGQTFELDKGGLCCRFVRQVWETALGFPAMTWRFGSPSAKETLAKLQKSVGKLPVGTPLKPGDIIGHRRGKYGHIGIVVSLDKGGLYCENTSDDKRGDPSAAGTKITRVSDWIGTYEAYRLGPN